MTNMLRELITVVCATVEIFGPSLLLMLAIIGSSSASAFFS